MYNLIKTKKIISDILLNELNKNKFYWYKSVPNLIANIAETKANNKAIKI